MDLIEHLSTVHGYAGLDADAAEVLHRSDHAVWASLAEPAPFDPHDHEEIPMTTTLDQARTDLAQRAQAADEAGDWRERNLLAPLAGVADMVCRIGDHTHSAHYRADKAGALVESALRVEQRALSAYGGVDVDDDDHRIDAAAEVLATVARAVRSYTWAVARFENGGDLFCESDANELRSALFAFRRWVDGVVATAVPDAVDE